MVLELTNRLHLLSEAQVNTQVYGKRPYGVGFLVAGHDVCTCEHSLLSLS